MKFEFNQDKAAEIAALYNLEEKVIRVWKTRNSIPSKYFDAEGNINKDVDTSDKINDSDKYRLLQVLESEHLNLSEFKTLSISKIADFKRGKATITANEFKEIKKELILLKNKFEPVIAAKAVTAKVSALKNLFKNPLLKPYTFAEGRDGFYAVDVIMNKDYDPDISNLEQIIINCSLFKQSIIL